MADLKPLNIDGTLPSDASKTTPAVDTTAADRVTTTDQPGGEDIVDQWLAEHPETEDVPAAPTTAATTTDATAAKPTDAATKPADTTAAPTTAPVDAAKPADKPTTQPSTLDASEKIRLADNVEWTREQVVLGLRERKAFADELQQYRSYFGDAEFVKKNWLPLLARFKSEPAKLQFVDGYLADPKKAEYLERCAAHFDREVKGAAVETTTEKPQYAQLSPEDRKSIDELRSYRENSEREAAVNRFNTEMAQCTSRFPIIAQDESLRKMLCSRAEVLYRHDQRLGLLNALEEMAPTLEALTIARNAAATAAPPATDPSALVTTTGAAPTTTRRPSRPDPKADPVDDWLRSDEAKAFN